MCSLGTLSRKIRESVCSVVRCLHFLESTEAEEGWLVGTAMAARAAEAGFYFFGDMGRGIFGVGGTDFPDFFCLNWTCDEKRQHTAFSVFLHATTGFFPN